jgi:mannosyltransferase
MEKSVSRLGNDWQYQVVAITAVTLLAAALRFYKLGQWSFWGDEYITVRRALDLFGGGIGRLTPSMLSTHLALNLLGVSEQSARLVAALVGTLTIPILYTLVRRQYNAHIALIASLLLAISSWHLYWSQNARFYTALLLFYTLALFFFYWALEEDRPLFMALSLIFFGLAAFERLISVFFIPTIALYLLMLKVGGFATPSGLRWRNLLIYLAPGVVIMLGLIALNPTFRDFNRLVNTFGFINNNPVWIFSGIVFYLGIPLLIMAAAGAALLLTRRDRFGLLLSLGFVVPFVSIMLISLFTYSANRYIFPTLTSVIVLAAFGLNELIRQMPRSGTLLATAVLLMLVAIPMADNLLYFQYQNGNRDNWKAALAFVAAHMADGEQVATVDPPLAEYYLGQTSLDMHYLEQAGLAVITDSASAVWFVIDLTAPDKTPQTTAWVREHAHLVQVFDVAVSARKFPMEVYRYTPPLP